MSIYTSNSENYPMALTKATAIDKIIIVSPYNMVKLREATIIQEDGVNVSLTYKHIELWPGSLDSEDNLVDFDVSGYSTEVQGVCSAVWTSDVKTKYKEYLIANK